ncbi:membrane fusion protein, macrolide-specific efflux system [Paracoccus aminovorans]|uniref:Membrane fusion protein, macrolide-specific efflux system n=1 Tax=Paracoccus aminovorans TaxID=34004 RepID=A0A1I2ZXB6_9RHOB|nr:efflux RND transporter periplasmic adaptor subunit [Paracoccus aminovorans]CQR84402.1 hemolysin secretion protein D [Paracoccus aminovorans]SFH42119.1 membrane fusion protein, macrolide-specific efflux system [Paracoccus aminovorans]
MRKPVLTALILAAVLAALAGTAWMREGQAKQQTYLTAPVARGDVEVAVMAEGKLKPSNLVAVGAQASGRITRLAVELGDRVEKGDLIAEIDSVTQENQLRTAKAALANLKAQMAEKQSVLALAEKTLDRQQNLMRSAASSRSDFDSAEQAVAAARAQLAALEAQIAEAEVAIETAEANLGYTRITAPSAGTVLAIVNRAGQTVNAVQSSPTIAVLGGLDRMNVHAEISEADIGKVRPGQKVRFTLLDDSGRSYEGVLESIAPAPQSIVNDSAVNPDSTADSDSSAVYYIGIVPVENPDGALRTYMTAQVSILLGEARDVLTIPATALGRPGRDGGYTVRVLGAGGSAETREIRVGLNDKVVAEVAEGLAEGEQVILGEQAGGAAASGDSGRRRMMGPPLGG